MQRLKIRRGTRCTLVALLVVNAREDLSDDKSRRGCGSSLGASDVVVRAGMQSGPRAAIHSGIGVGMGNARHCPCSSWGGDPRFDVDYYGGSAVDTLDTMFVLDLADRLWIVAARR